jgi:hypothetical protein
LNAQNTKLLRYTAFAFIQSTKYEAFGGRKNTGFRDAVADATKIPTQLLIELKK